MELLSEKTDAHSQPITSVVFSPDGTKIVSGSYDKTIKVWDIVNWSRKVQRSLDVQRGHPHCKKSQYVTGQ